MTELAMSDANPPACVSLLTLVSFRGVGIHQEPRDSQRCLSSGANASGNCAPKSHATSDGPIL